jgi:hypothetical protein
MMGIPRRASPQPRQTLIHTQPGPAAEFPCIPESNEVLTSSRLEIERNRNQVPLALESEHPEAAFLEQVPELAACITKARDKPVIGFKIYTFCIYKCIWRSLKYEQFVTFDIELQQRDGSGTERELIQAAYWHLDSRPLGFVRLEHRILTIVTIEVREEESPRMGTHGNVKYKNIII